jgi:NADPH-dependent 2,4-dienoyl-CoA reductase/sulfur reductase-like enzyme
MEGDRFEQAYDSLLISTGARALEPPIDGMDLDGVFTLHSMHEGGDVRAFIEEKDPDSVGIIGGGYIGLEMAEAFRGRGLHVELFEMLPHVLDPFGEPVAERVEEHLREEAVRVHLDTAVDAIRGERGRVSAIEADGEHYPVEMALVGTGIAPNAELADAAGIELGETGAIATDEYGRTSAEDVFAAGDCAEATNVITGRPDYVPLALTANRHGRAIGETVASSELTEVGPIAGTAVVKVFDLEVARTGIIDEELAAEAGFDPVSVTIEAESRAHYYPGGKPIRIQLMADVDSRRVLGAAMVGREGVAKRIDTVVTALHGRMTVDEVEMLDLAYAPPFSPVWDPVLTSAKVLASKVDKAQPVEVSD